MWGITDWGNDGENGVGIWIFGEWVDETAYAPGAAPEAGLAENTP